MAYVDYKYYKEFSGTKALPEDSFNTYLEPSEAYIDLITFNRVKELITVPEEVKKATCAVINTQSKLDVDGGIKTSESVGNVSVSYQVSSNASSSKKLYNSAKLYLAYTGLLYRGVY